MICKAKKLTMYAGHLIISTSFFFVAYIALLLNAPESVNGWFYYYPLAAIGVLIGSSIANKVETKCIIA